MDERTVESVGSLEPLGGDDRRHTPVFGWIRLRGLLEALLPRRARAPGSAGPEKPAPPGAGNPG